MSQQFIRPLISFAYLPAISYPEPSSSDRADAGKFFSRLGSNVISTFTDRSSFINLNALIDFESIEKVDTSCSDPDLK